MSKPLVLVVEDDQVIRMVAIANVRRFGDVEIKLARNGREALELIQTHRFALILMDVHMPEMDGLAATRAIREVEARMGRRTPIVAVTADPNKASCLEAGMDDYVTKPADYARVARRWLSNELRKSG